METIDYYHENRSDCVLLLLDASKAFDLVEYVKLFQTLRDRKMCPTVFGNFTYADDISLLCPTFSGIQFLQICEEYAFNYKITFNAAKSQLLYFSYLDKDHSDLLNLIVKDGNVIPYVSKCLHLGITIYTTLYRDTVIGVVNEFYKRTNYLL